MGSVAPEEGKTCWVTLVTKPSYLAGVVVLAHTLDQQKSKYPFIVQYTDGLGEEAISVLKAEAERSGRIIPSHVELLLPRQGQENMAGVAVAERFRDTFTKLRAFEVYKQGFSRACFLDADMAAFIDPDDVFETDMPRDWIAATHACVCTPDPSNWAPKAWQKGNCAYTLLQDPNQVAEDISSRPTYGLLNGGLFLFYPTEDLWVRMMGFFNYTERLKDYQFPDQDFLADFFKTKWRPLSWKYNAIKTHPYIHPPLWSKDKVVILHYIVDKPWDRRVSSDGIGGHKGRDGEIHLWWEKCYDSWKQTQKSDSKALAVLDRVVYTQEPITETTPLTFVPGTPDDVKSYEESMDWVKVAA